VSGYKAVLFAPDGDYVTDYRRETIEEVREALADQGSRWFFYPFEAIIRAHSLTRDTLRIVEAAEPIEHLSGRTIKTVSRTLAAMPDDELAAWLA
jgi:hypothetical protein